MKLKENKGSALILAIIITALMSMTVMIISSQINNQIKFNSRQYEDMKYKYMAEAGIEKAIYDIKEEIKSKVKYNKSRLKNYTYNNHENCPKVDFDENGKPRIDGDNGFYKLIMSDILTNEIELYSYYQDVLYNDIRFIVGDEVAQSLKLYYEINISIALKEIYTNVDSYNRINIENNINTFIEEIEKIIIKIEESGQSGIEEKITNLEGIKLNMMEIKCRLGMSLDEVKPNPNPEPDLESVFINVPQYVVTLKDGNLNFLANNTLVQIDIQRDSNGVLETINLANLNSKTNTDTYKLVSISENQKIESKIEFIFDKSISDYDIRYRVNSYEQKQN